MRPLIRNLVATIRTSARTRWTSVKQLRSETRAALADCRARRRLTARGVREALHQHRAVAVRSIRRSFAPAGIDPDTGLTDDGLEAEVLRVIARHPEGVPMLDIGNELGVDWRRVLIVTTRLVDRAVVEQIEQEFYPVTKGSW